MRGGSLFLVLPGNSWYSFYRPRKDERLSRPWSHPVVLNTGPLDWESSALTTRPLLQNKKQRPKIIKSFENDNFCQDLKKELLKFDITNVPLSKFNDIVLSVLDKHAPKKMKYICLNNCNFMTKELRKAIMNRSKLRNKESHWR